MAKCWSIHIESWLCSAALLPNIDLSVYSWQWQFIGHCRSYSAQFLRLLRKSRGLNSVSAYRHGLYIQVHAWGCSAFVGGTVSTWARWRIPVNKGIKGIRNADQALTVRGEHADRTVGSPSWWSSINYNISTPEDLKLSQIGSSQLPPPFRGLRSPGVRKHCQIIFAWYFRKSSIGWQVL